MKESVLDAVLELVTTAIAAVGAVALTGLGVLAEQAGVQNLAGGNIPVGVWEVGMGAVILFAGVYLLGYRQVWWRVHRLLA